MELDNSHSFHHPSDTTTSKTQKQERITGQIVNGLLYKDELHNINFSTKIGKAII
jgi:hypothetical protein